MQADTPMDIDMLRSSAEEASRLMKVLSNPARLLLLCQLAQGEQRVGELEAMVGIVDDATSWRTYNRAHDRPHPDDAHRAGLDGRDGRPGRRAVRRLHATGCPQLPDLRTAVPPPVPAGADIASSARRQ